MAGILAGHYLHLPGVGVLFVAFLSLIGIVVTLGRRTKIIPVFLVLLLWASLGLLSYQFRYQRCPQDDIVRYSSDQPILVRLQGQVLNDAHWAKSSRPWPGDPSQYFPSELAKFSPAKDGLPPAEVCGSASTWRADRTARLA